jgi:hypothetical protein
VIFETEDAEVDDSEVDGSEAVVISIYTGRRYVTYA